uniref:Immunoglobulin V-set domain-containing protein n=1 Tax=Nothobranchius kadleci TaxID=1051664 RepID=A0A1A8CGP7_NOTKA
MKTRLDCAFIFIQIFEACAELVFKRLTEGQSLGLSCLPQEDHGPPVGLHLYHRGVQTQTTLLSLSAARAVRVDPERRERLQLSGGLDSIRINVSISDLQLSDSGLYTWELSYRERNISDRMIQSEQKVFLLVEGAGRPRTCAHSCTPLLWTITAAAGLLLLAFSWMILERCVKLRHHSAPQPHSPIYEEMSRKQQTPGSPQNNHEAPSHLEEVHFPVYANPNVRPQQENYYACPRQLVLRA